MLRLIGAWAVLVCVACDVYAFGEKGHRLVGAIADKLLESKPEGVKVKALLQGISLSDAAMIADDIKRWDLTATTSYPWTSNATLQGAMKAFVEDTPDHSVFHYTNISVIGDGAYAVTKRGARADDIVQMINHCIRVIQTGQPVAGRPTITPTVATILLAHYVGDLHQPLHVGAAYFDPSATLVDADTVTNCKVDLGGNLVQLLLQGGPTDGMNLHFHWDITAVDDAIAVIKQATHGTGSTLTPGEIDSHFVVVQPVGWPLDAGVAIDGLSTAWANEMMPLALEARLRLTFENIPNPPRVVDYNKYDWTAKQAGTPAVSYTPWSGTVVDTTMHRAGWRLAALLEQLLK